jgi:hypothetical protein
MPVQWIGSINSGCARSMRVVWPSRPGSGMMPSRDSLQEIWAGSSRLWNSKARHCQVYSPCFPSGLAVTLSTAESGQVVSMGIAHATPNARPTLLCGCMGVIGPVCIQYLCWWPPCALIALVASFSEAIGVEGSVPSPSTINHVQSPLFSWEAIATHDLSLPSETFVWHTAS